MIHALLYAVTGARSAWPDYLGGQLTEAPALETLASRQAHEVLVFVLFGLVLLHVGGVMVHEVRERGVLPRMMPFLARPAASPERETW